MDAGPGSANTNSVGALPGERLDGMLLTHFHSDHIAEIPTVNLTSWVAGRQGPLRLYGPPGVQRIADGFNEAFAQDRDYRTTHHGADFMPPEFGELEAIERPVESILVFGELTRATGVGMTALYHLVPGPRNVLMENIFKREFVDNMVLTRDRMWFTLPVGSDDILVD